jgi:hypothetical protein
VPCLPSLFRPRGILCWAVFLGSLTTYVIPCRVNIKARTHEKVDSIGEGRALSCHAVVLLEKKPSANADKAADADGTDL